jgi:hypothetical protein
MCIENKPKGSFVSEHFVPTPHGRLVFRTFWLSGCFVLPDILSLWTFCPMDVISGHYVSGRFSLDVLSIRTFDLRTFDLRTFCLGTALGMSPAGLHCCSSQLKYCLNTNFNFI